MSIFLVGVLTAAAAVVQAGNQAGKLVTVLAMETIRTKAATVDEVMIPTFGRLHLRIEDHDDVSRILSGTREDYRPVTLALALGAAALTGVGGALLIASQQDNVGIGAASGITCGAVVAAITFSFAKEAAHLLATRMAQGIDSPRG